MGRVGARRVIGARLEIGGEVNVATVRRGVVAETVSYA